MITVKDAYYKSGYSPVDPLLHNSDLEAIIGRQFRSVAEARTAAERLRSGEGRRHDVPLGLEVLFADGTTKTF